MSSNNLTIKSILEGYKNKSFSVTEIVKHYLEQIKNNDSDLNSFITLNSQQALDDAEKKDKLLMTKGITEPLFGIPLGFKDIYLTKGIRTTAASKVLEDYVPVYNSTAVQKLTDSGAIIIGKTNCDAWAHGSSGENSDFGPTKNPWNRDYTPGGSSSGSAAAVAASLVPAATGTDTGGSIRLPASFTNTVGLKPTYGLVSRYGIISMASSLDSIGHFTNTVYDSALLLNITAGKDPYDATTIPNKKLDFTKEIGKDIKNLKIGVPKEYVDNGLSSTIKNIFNNTVKIFSDLGADITTVSLPHTKFAVACYYIIQPSEVSSNLGRYDGVRYGNSRSAFGSEAKRRIMLGTFALSSGYYDAYYLKAMKVRTLIKNDFDTAYKDVDIILSPVSPTPPWKLGEKTDDPLQMYLSDILTISANLSGIPGLSIPAGFTENGLPAGIQLLGPHFSESTLFKAGYAFEQVMRLYNRRPEKNE
jgi:aspartyl-tRNA(Asn)/glutamyl-tRNA(Gln) amidotransferase subunit A